MSRATITLAIFLLAAFGVSALSGDFSIAYAALVVGVAVRVTAGAVSIAFETDDGEPV